MKLYRQEKYRYCVLEHKGYFFRFGYKLRRFQFGLKAYRAMNYNCFTLWFLGLFLQFDYNT